MEVRESSFQKSPPSEKRSADSGVARVIVLLSGKQLLRGKRFLTFADQKLVAAKWVAAIGESSRNSRHSDQSTVGIFVGSVSQKCNSEPFAYGIRHMRIVVSALPDTRVLPSAVIASEKTAAS